MKAENDLTAAQRLVDAGGPYDVACFHAQQAAERWLKAFLALSGARIPFSHDLDELREACLEARPAPALASVELSELTPYAVRLRYDLAFWPDPATAVEAIRMALAVREAILSSMPPEAWP